MDKVRLIELLRKWEHPFAWETYYRAVESALDSNQFRTQLEREQQGAELDTKAREQLTRLRELEEGFLVESAEKHSELNEIRSLIEAMVPRLVRYFPAVVYIHDRYKPGERAEMVRIVLGEVLASEPRTIEPATPTTADDLREKINKEVRGRPVAKKTPKVAEEYERLKKLCPHQTDEAIGAELKKTLHLKTKPKSIIATAKRHQKKVK